MQEIEPFKVTEDFALDLNKATVADIDELIASLEQAKNILRAVKVHKDNRLKYGKAYEDYLHSLGVSKLFPQ